VHSFIFSDAAPSGLVPPSQGGAAGGLVANSLTVALGCGREVALPLYPYNSSVVHISP
jgi:hypothetical protein